MIAAIVGNGHEQGKEWIEIVNTAISLTVEASGGCQFE